MSGKWKSFQRGIRKNTMRMLGLQRDGALEVVSKHLAYAKVRIDSTAGPLAKMCFMLVPTSDVRPCSKHRATKKHFQRCKTDSSD